MATYYKTGKTWAVAFKLKGCRRGYVYGIRTERLAKQIKSQKDLQEQLAKAGIHNAPPHANNVEAAELKPIDEHVDAFQKAIVARGKNPQHAQQQASHVRRLLSMTRARHVSQIEHEAVQAAASG